MTFILKTFSVLAIVSSFFQTNETKNSNPFTDAKAIGFLMEICDNGIDDDGNGLIDFQDPACDCDDAVLLNPLSIINNPDFEERDGCCSTNLGTDNVDNCITDWEVVIPSIDYYNPDCIDDFEGIDAYIRGYISENGATMESPGTCFATPLTEGFQYQLEFDLRLGGESNNQPLWVGIYGVTDCADLTAVEVYNLCGNDEFTELTKFNIGDITDWENWNNQSVNFFADAAYTGFALSYSCSSIQFPNASNFCYLDNFSIAESIESVVMIEPSGYLCSDDLVLSSSQNFSNNFSFQWYQNGVALIGENTLTLEVEESGEYFLLISDDNGSCKRSNFMVAEDLAPVQVVEEAVICQGAAIDYEFFGSTYNETGIYDYLDSQAGACDTLYTLVLEVKPPLVGTYDSELLLPGQVFFFNGMEITESGIYYENFVTQDGCDSVNVLEIIDFPMIFPEDCNNGLDDDGDGFIDAFDDDCACNATDLVNEINVNGNLCSETSFLSVEAIDLVTYQWFKDSIPINNANESDFFFTENVQNLAGIYHVVATFPDGNCQLIGPLNFVLPMVSTEFNVLICPGEVYPFGDVFLNSQGIYTETFSTVNDCDSLVTVTLDFLPISDDYSVEAICENETFTFNGTLLNMPGNYSDTLQNTVGCDSILNLLLIVNPNVTEEFSVTACAGENYLFNGNSLTQSGVYQEVFQTANGCDSMVMLNLNFLNPILGDTTIITQNQGSDYDFFGQSVTQSGIYEATFTSVLDCDSLVFLNINFVNPCADPFDFSVEWLEPTCDAANNGAITFFTNAVNAPFIYSIDNGITFSEDAFFENLTVGNYDLLVTDNLDCIATMNFDLNPEFSNLSLELPADTVLNLGESLIINPLNINFPATSFSWSSTQNIDCSTCEEIEITPTESATYTLTLDDGNGCEATASIFVDIRTDLSLYFPNVFTPNGDRSNDVFQAIGAETAVSRIREISIYSRWGNLVFQSNNPTAGWDGTHHQKVAESGVYIYAIRWENEEGEEVLLTGDVTLIR